MFFANHKLLNKITMNLCIQQTLNRPSEDNFYRTEVLLVCTIC